MPEVGVIIQSQQWANNLYLLGYLQSSLAFGLMLINVTTPTTKNPNPLYTHRVRVPGPSQFPTHH
mgnify:CR=1 FL=1